MCNYRHKICIKIQYNVLCIKCNRNAHEEDKREKRRIVNPHQRIFSHKSQVSIIVTNSNMHMYNILRAIPYMCTIYYNVGLRQKCFMCTTTVTEKNMKLPYPRERGPMGSAPYTGPRLGDGPVSVLHLDAKKHSGKLLMLSS